MLHTYVMGFGGQWVQYLALAEFACNNNNHSSIEMTIFEALYGWHYRFSMGSLRLDLWLRTCSKFLNRVWVIQDRL